MRTSRSVSAVVIVLGLASAAPTVGDVGGCGREATLLDEPAFTRARKLEDCERCSECGITTARCARACNPEDTAYVDLPETCRPLLRDGEVCLRALHAASCGDYAGYVDDTAPTTPSECAFCRVAPPSPPPTFVDGGP